MKYFNGFSLKGEETLFEAYLDTSEYCVSGFSFGAQQALEYAYNYTGRIDKLILLSPAFFHNQKTSFKRTQLRYFQADKNAYVETFLRNVSSPSQKSLDGFVDVGTVEELDALLSYIWETEKLESLLNRGVSIEVFLGEEDKIIECHEALDFFKELCPTYWIKKCGHLLS